MPVYFFISAENMTSDEDDVPLSIIKAREFKNFEERESEKKAHEARVDELLKANNLRRLPVSADGDCFFSAVLPQVDYTDIRGLRCAISEHMIANTVNYMSLMCDMDKKTFRTLAKKIKKLSFWKSDLCDILPLAVANYFQQKVRIYHSDSKVVCVEPSIGDGASIIHDIVLAYLSVPMREHYDRVESIPWHDILLSKFKLVVLSY